MRRLYPEINFSTLISNIIKHKITKIVFLASIVTFCTYDKIKIAVERKIVELKLAEVQKSLQPFANKFKMEIVGKEAKSLLVTNINNPGVNFYVSLRENTKNPPDHANDYEVKYFLDRGYIVANIFNEPVTEANGDFSYSTMLVNVKTKVSAYFYDLKNLRIVEVISLNKVKRNPATASSYSHNNKEIKLEDFDYTSTVDFIDLRRHLSASF